MNDAGVYGHQESVSMFLTVWMKGARGRGGEGLVWRTSGAGSQEPVRASLTADSPHEHVVDQ